MKPPSYTSVVDSAGRVYALRRELTKLNGERKKLEEKIHSLESSLAQAQTTFDQVYGRLASPGGNHGSRGLAPEDQIVPGRLPHRILCRMREEPARVFTAAELRTELRIRDVQQVRTALARLVDRGLVRRLGTKGQFALA